MKTVPPRAYEKDSYPWHLGKVPLELPLGESRVPHPAHTNALFVVHGMGTQTLAATAASLRCGIEDALERIQDWQHAQGISSPLGQARTTPPPFIWEGYWANYDDLRSTFPEDWEALLLRKPSENGRRGPEQEKRDLERNRFFVDIWQRRAFSTFRTIRWLLLQLPRLLSPRVMIEVGPLAWLLYIPLQIVAIAVLLGSLLLRPRIVSRVLADVRLYIAPRGVVERAIVQRIDYRVGRQFMKLLGLDWDFRPLPVHEALGVGHTPTQFQRVVWVAHSLGSVISYNVLSDLFARAAELERGGDPGQRQGVQRFRQGLVRFVTMGSPLDKIAFLFPEALRPWPDAERQQLLPHGEPAAGGREWWVNFYHVLDPVSGSLSNTRICGARPPMNFHIGLARLPGLAHVAYWNDPGLLRFVMTRIYGRQFLPDRPVKAYAPLWLTLFAAVGYLVWAALILAVLVGIGALVYYAPQIIRWWISR